MKLAPKQYQIRVIGRIFPPVPYPSIAFPLRNAVVRVGHPRSLWTHVDVSIHHPRVAELPTCLAQHRGLDGHGPFEAAIAFLSQMGGATQTFSRCKAPENGNQFSYC